jgi:hypothetical protein
MSKEFSRLARGLSRIDRIGRTSNRQITMKSADSFLSPEELVGEEWAEWYLRTPIERWEQSSVLWQTYLTLGCSLEPESDTQSPFFDGSAPGSVSAYGRPGLRVLRSGRVQ